MVTRDEYLAHAAADESWAPGWLAIEEAFESTYPGIEPTHLATDFQTRAIMGSPNYIDGFSIYPSPNGYQHIVTFGMSTLYVDEESFGEEFSGWGYEMTMKVRADHADDCLWAVDLLNNLARYTYEKPRLFEPYEFASAGGGRLVLGTDTLLTGIMFAPDTEVPGIDTVHGRVDFLQLVGITQTEMDWLDERGPQEAETRAQELADRLMQSGNPHLVTDLGRSEEYA